MTAGNKKNIGLYLLGGALGSALIIFGAVKAVDYSREYAGRAIDSYFGQMEKVQLEKLEQDGQKAAPLKAEPSLRCDVVMSQEAMKWYSDRFRDRIAHDYITYVRTQNNGNYIRGRIAFNCSSQNGKITECKRESSTLGSEGLAKAIEQNLRGITNLPSLGETRVCGRFEFAF